METYNPNTKQIGSYLIDAGLITPTQVKVALADQEKTGMRFGEILVMRGWVKKQTLEYVVGKVVMLERSIGQPLGKRMFEKAYKARKKRRDGAM